MPDTLLGIAKKHGVPARVVGHVGAIGAPLQITTASTQLNAPLARLDEAYYEAIPSIISQTAGASQ